MIRDVGDLVALATVLRDSAGAVNNAATMALLVTKPDGSTATPAVTNTGAGGIYTATVTVDQAGTWLYRWTASGAVVSVEADQFTVASPGRVLVAALEEFKVYVRRTDNGDDAGLREDLTSATDWLEWKIGGPLSVQTFTELVPVGGMWVTPLRRPIVAFVSLTPELGTAIDSSFIVTDLVRNSFRLRWGAVTGWYTLVYTAGLAAGPSARHKKAGLELARHLQLVRNGTSGRGFPGDEVQTPMGFAVPRRVDELLSGVDAAMAGFA
jgi:hypothetical protein